MPKEFSRKLRVANAIKKLIAPVITRYSKDQGFGLVSVTDIDVSPDLKQSDIYLSVYGEADLQAEVIAFFNELAGTIRGEIARDMTTKRHPALHFKIDKGLERGDRMARLLSANSDSDG
ncbi:MAG: 30S ribosome-binding factor RbfA [Pseudomonadota bacterium]